MQMTAAQIDVNHYFFGKIRCLRTENRTKLCEMRIVNIYIFRAPFFIKADLRLQEQHCLVEKCTKVRRHPTPVEKADLVRSCDVSDE